MSTSETVILRQELTDRANSGIMAVRQLSDGQILEELIASHSLGIDEISLLSQEHNGVTYQAVASRMLVGANVKINDELVPSGHSILRRRQMPSITADAWYVNTGYGRRPSAAYYVSSRFEAGLATTSADLWSTVGRYVQKIGGKLVDERDGNVYIMPMTPRGVPLRMTSSTNIEVTHASRCGDARSSVVVLSGSAAIRRDDIRPVRVRRDGLDEGTLTGDAEISLNAKISVPLGASVYVDDGCLYQGSPDDGDSTKPPLNPYVDYVRAYKALPAIEWTDATTNLLSNPQFISYARSTSLYPRIEQDTYGKLLDMARHVIEEAAPGVMSQTPPAMGALSVVELLQDKTVRGGQRHMTEVVFRQLLNP